MQDGRRNLLFNGIVLHRDSMVLHSSSVILFRVSGFRVDKNATLKGSHYINQPLLTKFTTLKGSHQRARLVMIGTGY